MPVWVIVFACIAGYIFVATIVGRTVDPIAKTRWKRKHDHDLIALLAGLLWPLFIAGIVPFFIVIYLPYDSAQRLSDWVENREERRRSERIEQMKTALQVD